MEGPRPSEVESPDPLLPDIAGLGADAQFQVLRNAAPEGTTVVVVQALFGEPDGRIDLSGSGPQALTWTYPLDKCTIPGLKLGFAVDFDLHDRVVAVRKLGGRGGFGWGRRRR